MNIESVINCVASNSVSIMNSYYDNLCKYEIYNCFTNNLPVLIVVLIICITVNKTYIK